MHKKNVSKCPWKDLHKNALVTFIHAPSKFKTKASSVVIYLESGILISKKHGSISKKILNLKCQSQNNMYSVVPFILFSKHTKLTHVDKNKNSGYFQGCNWLERISREVSDMLEIIHILFVMVRRCIHAQKFPWLYTEFCSFYCI